MHKAQVLVDQRPQHKSSYTDLIEDKMENSLEHIVPEDNFLNIIPIAQTLRLTINKWDLMKLESFCKL